MPVPNVTLEKVEAALRRLPPERMADVLLLVEFLEYRAHNGNTSPQDDAEEEAALWAAVEANQAYKAQHPGEMIVHESGADFLVATADL